MVLLIAIFCLPSFLFPSPRRDQRCVYLLCVRTHFYEIFIVHFPPKGFKKMLIKKVGINDSKSISFMFNKTKFCIFLSMKMRSNLSTPTILTYYKFYNIKVQSISCLRYKQISELAGFFPYRFPLISLPPCFVYENNLRWFLRVQYWMLFVAAKRTQRQQRQQQRRRFSSLSFAEFYSWKK